MKVYIVWNDEYPEDRMILGIFTTKELADEFVVLYNKSYITFQADKDVEEHEVRSDLPPS